MSAGMARIAVIPAFEASRTVGSLVAQLLDGFDDVWVIDDGSTDGTGDAARGEGARVFRHPTNMGKGAALRTALERAAAEGVDAIVTVDADGQHPPAEAIRLDRAVDDRGALVLGVRDLVASGAPSRNVWSNGVSNYWLSRFAGRALRDTQCGLRRYPVSATLSLGARGERFSFESEVVLRASLGGLRIVELPVDVKYPPDRTTHFDSVRDPARMIVRVLSTAAGAKVGRLMHRSR